MKIRIHHLLVLLVLFAPATYAAVLRVGSGCTHTTLSSALNVAQPGDELRLRTETFTGNWAIAVSDLTIRGGYSSCSATSPSNLDRATLSANLSNRPTLRLASAAANLTLDRLVLINANNPSASAGLGEGGAIHLGPATSATLGYVSMYNNAAGRGAGIFVSSNATLKSASTAPGNELDVSYNIASGNGGGIFLDTNATLDLITDAPARIIMEHNEGLGGAGIYASSGSIVQAKNLQMHTNAAASTGGGIYLAPNAAQLYLSDCEFSDNTAAANGGAISSAANAALILRCDFENNAATLDSGTLGSGGALYLRGGQSTIRDSLFTSNQARRGGAAYLSLTDSTSFLGTRFSANTSRVDGGAIYAHPSLGPLRIKTSPTSTPAASFDGNSAVGDGGAIYVTSSTGQMLEFDIGVGDQAVFSGNQASNGGAIRIHDTDVVLPQALVLTDNEASGNGGAISITGASSVSIATDSADWLGEINGNIAQTGNGGVFHADGDVDLLLDWMPIGGDPFAFNRGVNGGAIFFNSTGLLRLRNTRLRYNSAQFSGAGVFAGVGAHVLIDAVQGVGMSNDPQPLPRCNPLNLPANRYCSEIASNQIPGSSGQGGGLAAASTASFQVSHTALLGNSSAQGSALLVAPFTYAMLDTVLVSGQAQAIFVDTDASLALQSSTITANGTATLKLANSSSTQLTVFDSIIWGNTEAVSGGANATIDGDCNLSQSASIPGTYVDPQFVATARGNYRLPSTSYAVDLCSGSASNDLDNQSRPYGVNADAGAFEYAPSDRIFAHGFE